MPVRLRRHPLAPAAPPAARPGPERPSAYALRTVTALVERVGAELELPAPRRTSTLRVTAEALLVGAAAAALAVWVFRIWDASLSVPFYQQSPDTWQITSWVKGIHDHGWYLANPDLGAPFGTQFYDFPMAGETLQLGAIWVITRFVSRPGMVVNLYFLGGFALLAAVTHGVLRHLRFRAAVAAPVALLYTFLPYHFWHQEAHLFRSAYVSGPLGALLILWVLDWRRRFLVDPGSPVRGWSALAANLRWRRVAAAAAVAAVIGVFETMAIAFVLVALVVGALLVALRDRDPGVLAAAGAAVAVTVLAFAVALAPNLWYWSQNGRNPSAARRMPTEQELYGLKISQLLLPIPQHRSATLARLAARAADGTPVASEGGQQLGIVGAAGFLAALYGGLYFGAGSVRRRRASAATRAGRGPDPDGADPGRDGRRPHAWAPDRAELWSTAGMLTLVLVLFATVSGLSMLLSLKGFAQIRVWNRAVVLIAFFSLLVVAIGLERLLGVIAGRIRRPGRAVAAGTLASIAVLGFGLWDTAVPFPTDYPAITRQALADKGFVTEVERRLPAGAAVFELPVVPFPETPMVNELEDYREAVPYQYSRTLRWSYGGMKGRPQADWQRKVPSDAPVPALAGLRGLGFDGIVVFTRGYADGGAAVAGRLSAVLGPPEVQSGDGTKIFWDLRDYGRISGLGPRELRTAARALAGGLVGGLPVTR